MTNDLSVLRHMVKNRKEQIQLLQAIRDLDQELSKLTHITYIPKPPPKSSSPPSKSLGQNQKKTSNPVLTFPVSLRSGVSILRSPSPRLFDPDNPEEESGDPDIDEEHPVSLLLGLEPKEICGVMTAI